MTRKRSNLLDTLEDFLYDLCLIVIFFPWQFVQLLLRPRHALNLYYSSEQQEKATERVVSPTLFLIICSIIIVDVLPDVDFGNRIVFSGFAHTLSSDAHVVQIAAVVGPTLLLAICNALLIEWLTPGTVTRESFRMPLFMSTLVAAMFVTFMATLFALLGTVQGHELPAWRAVAALPIMPIAFIWYLWAQSDVVMKLAQVTRWKAVGVAIAATILNEIAVWLLPG